MADSEADRLKALRAFGILDSPANPRLDRLTRMAADVFDTPIALVSLVDEKRQWFLSRVGLDATETPREWSFCAHAIAHAPNSLFVVRDASTDPRFERNPLVISEPHIRFYAGAVLTDQHGFNLGSLCAIDTKTREQPSSEQLEKLQLLAQLVVSELEILKRDQMLEEREAIFQMTEEISGIASWKYDVAETHFIGSPLAYRIHGIDPAIFPMDIETALSLYSEQDRARILNLMNQALTSGDAYELQSSITRPDGEKRDVLVKTEGRKNLLGQVTALVGVFQDITDQVRAAQEMADAKRQSERLNWALEAFAKSAAALTRFDDPTSLFKHICETITEGGRYPLAVVELAENDADKTIRVVAGAGSAREYLNGLELSWAEDKATGRGPAGQTTRTGKTVVALDLQNDRNFAVWHDRALTFGLRASATIPFETPDHRSGLLAVYSDSPDSFSSAELDVFSKLAAELTYALKLEKSRRELVESDQRRAQLIEELQKSQHTISEALGRANAANLSKSTFLANMSHELRTPLNGILGVAGALRLSLSDTKQSEMVSLIEESASNLNLILSDILDWSKVEAGKVVLSPAPFSPKAAFRPTIDLMAVRAEEKGLAFDVELASDGDGCLEGDALRINQILANLLSNAIKFTDTGKVTCRVSVQSDGSDNRRLTIGVWDTGSGFSEADKARLFDRFEQLDASTTRRYGGTGLGLPIVAALVELMNGEISVVSGPNEGTFFEVRLPLKIASGLVDEAPVVDEAPIPQGLSVLLAEDHPTNQKVVSMILEPLGVKLTIVENGEDAVSAWETGGFDLILMDMQMPKMGGLEAIQIIREREAKEAIPYTPVAVLTANVGTDYQEASLEAGADGYIAKPISPNSLLTGIHQTFDTVMAKFAMN